MQVRDRGANVYPAASLGSEPLSLGHFASIIGSLTLPGACSRAFRALGSLWKLAPLTFGRYFGRPFPRYCPAAMHPSVSAALITLFCLSCASGSGSSRPSQPEPRPACFTGTGAIDLPSPVTAVSAPQGESYGVGGLGAAGQTGGPAEGTIGLNSGNRPQVLTVIPGQPLFQGAVDRENLRRTIRQHVHQLATCRT